MPFSTAHLADTLLEGLRVEACRLDTEHAVHGIDACDELQLHLILAGALRAGGYGVHREQRYPADRDRRKRSDGERCDLVITPDDRALREPDRAPTLFDPADAVDLDDAFWMEVKVVAQFRPGGPNAGYSGQLLSTVTQDVAKLSRDRGILHAGLLIVMFVADATVAEHDLSIWQDRCLQQCLPISAPAIRDLELTNRIGNGVCRVALYGVAHY